MFKKDLKEKLQAIFNVKKVSFDLPGDEVGSSNLLAAEQETLFVVINEAKSTIKDSKAIAKVEGVGIMYAPMTAHPFGYFQKCIHQAGAAKTKDFFFHKVDENKGRIGDVSQRTFDFVFFYSSQYDPDNGTITSIDFEGDE